MHRYAWTEWLEFVLGLWTTSTANHILSTPMPEPDHCLYNTEVLLSHSVFHYGCHFFKEN